MGLTSKDKECRRRLPLAPLLEASGMSISSLAIAAGVNRKSIHRWAHEGVPLFRVDEIAVKVLGVHPACIYGDKFLFDESESSAAA